MSDPPNMTRDSRLSFRCNRCSRCCYHKTIKVNPYEVARLAANRGLDTTVFIERYTVMQGTALDRNGDGSCVFLGEEGCTVHADRPFVCRLYPLLRRTDGAGAETFATVKLHPLCEGEWGEEGTVGEYLAGQGAGVYIDAVDAYLELTAKIVSAINAIAEEMRDAGGSSSGVPDEPAGIDMDEVDRWLDMDSMLLQQGHSAEELKATNAAGKMLEHISLIEARLKTLRERDDHGE